MVLYLGALAVPPEDLGSTLRTHIVVHSSLKPLSPASSHPMPPLAFNNSTRHAHGVRICTQVKCSDTVFKSLFIQQTPGIPLSLLSHCWNSRHHHIRPLYSCWGPKLRSLILVQQTSYQLNDSNMD